MTRKIFILLGIVWGMGLLVVAIIAIRDLGGNIKQKASVPQSFASAVGTGNNTAVISNGQALAEYNYTTGQVQPLSENVGLDAIDTVSVSSSDKYVVFHDQNVAQDGSLAAQLRSRQLNPALDYWWVFDVQNKIYEPLPQGILLAKVGTNQVYALTYDNTFGESIATYSTSDLQKISAISIPASSDFFVTPNGFLLQTADNRVLLTKDGIVTRVLFKSTTLIGVTWDETTAVAVTTNSNTRNMVAINLKNYQTTTVAAGVVNLPVWLGSGTALYATNQSKLYSYDTSTKKITQWKLGGNAASLSISNLKLVALVGSSAAVINDGSPNYYLLGSNLAPTTQLK